MLIASVVKHLHIDLLSGGYNIEQFKLVQPSNATVLTGVALESSESDRVHIILRKDTRRARYRTTIMVGDVVRYFDNMQLQRFRGKLSVT